MMLYDSILCNVIMQCTLIAAHRKIYFEHNRDAT